MEGSYYYYSDGEEQSYVFNYGTSDFYNEQASIEVWSDPDYDEGSYEDSSPQQPVWGCCAHEAASSSDEEQSQPDCSCQNASSTGSDEVSPRSVSEESRTSSDWEMDDGSKSVASDESGKACSGPTDGTDSCRISSRTSSSSWETASTEESESSWETATTCSCEAADESTACQCCRQAVYTTSWDDEPPTNPDCSRQLNGCPIHFSEGGGGSGSLVPLPPSASLPRALSAYQRWRKMNSSGVGRRQGRRKVTEQKQARRPCTVQAISAPAANPIAAQKASPARINHKSTRPRRRRFRWHPVYKKRKAATTNVVKIGDGVAGPSSKN